MHDPDITVGTEAMSDQARPRPITARMTEEGRGTEQDIRRMPVIDDKAILGLVWWAAKLSAIANGQHVRVLEGRPEEDANAIDGGEVLVGGFDGARVPISAAAMREASISIQARQKCRELEEWARGLCEEGVE